MNKILKIYKQKEANLNYNLAQELLSLITDEEFYDLIQTYPDCFAKITAISCEQDKVKYLDEIKKSIDLFIQTIESRGLTKDEYDAMTLDDILEYIGKIVDQSDIDLYPIIQLIEEAKR